MPPFNDFTFRIIGAAFRVHNTLGPGFYEHIYETILPGHQAQLRAYLRACGRETGLVLNFGPVRVGVKLVVETRVKRGTG